MQTRRTRFPWAALITGLVLGIVGGLWYAWFLNPVNFVDIGPDRLGAEDRRAYVLLVSEAYLQDHDLERARARLSALGVHDVAELVAVQADSALLRGAPPEEVRALTTLAEALGARPMAAEVFSGTVVPTSTPAPATGTPTFEELPNLTPSPTAGPPTLTPTVSIPSPTPDLFPDTEMSLLEMDAICEDDYPAGRIEVYVYDSFDRGIPAIKVLVEWSGGEDTFFTGLKPEIDPGYADFQMTPGVIYTLTLVDLAEPVLGIDSSACLTPSGQPSVPTYRLVFVPAVEIEEP